MPTPDPVSRVGRATYAVIATSGLAASGAELIHLNLADSERGPAELILGLVVLLAGSVGSLVSVRALSPVRWHWAGYIAGLACIAFPLLVTGTPLIRFAGYFGFFLAIAILVKDAHRRATPIALSTPTPAAMDLGRHDRPTAIDAGLPAGLIRVLLALIAPWGVAQLLVLAPTSDLSATGDGVKPWVLPVVIAAVYAGCAVIIFGPLRPRITAPAWASAVGSLVAAAAAATDIHLHIHALVAAAFLLIFAVLSSRRQHILLVVALVVVVSVVRGLRVGWTSEWVTVALASGLAAACVLMLGFSLRRSASMSKELAHQVTTIAHLTREQEIQRFARHQHHVAGQQLTTILVA